MRRTHSRLLWIFGFILSVFPPAFSADEEPVATDGAGIDPSRFESVEHRTEGIRGEERSAFETVLERVVEIDLQRQEEQAQNWIRQRRALYDETESEFSLIRDLLRSPEKYQGHPIAIAGQVQRIVPTTLIRRNADADPLFEVWLWPIGGEVPFVVLTPHLPAEMPTGENLSEPSILTGWFFKIMELPEEMQAISVAPGETPPRVAPLLIARTIEWHPVRTDQPGRLEPIVVESARHKKRHFDDTERYAYYRGIYYAQRVDDETREKAAKDWMKKRERRFHADPKNENKQYSLIADLYNNYQQMPGQAITVQGYARKIESYPAGKNQFDIETLYEAWVFADEGQGFPVVVVFTELPDGVETGLDIYEPIAVTGYFFKMYVYDADDNKTRFAPLLMAHRVETWQPEPTRRWNVYWILVVVTGFVILGVFVFFLTSSGRKSPVIVDTSPSIDPPGPIEQDSS